MADSSRFPCCERGFAGPYFSGSVWAPEFVDKNDFSQMRYLALAAFSLLFGCSAPEMIPQATGEGPFARWEVHMIMSGGFAGIRQTLLATSDGQLVARDLKRGTTVEQRVDKKTEQDIARALNVLSGERPNGSPFPGRCRDCFNYEIQAVLDGERRYVRLSSEHLEDSPYKDLVKILSETMRRALGG